MNGKYDYEHAVTQELKYWITHETDILINRDAYGSDEELAEWIEDEVWAEDSVTGNGDFGYAEEDECLVYLGGNADLLYEAANAFDLDNGDLTIVERFNNRSLAQYFDTCIRCYLLQDCIDLVIKELKLNID